MDGFKFLLKRGSTICTTVNGSTVLMEAVNRNRLDFVDYLVSNAAKLGLDVQVRRVTVRKQHVMYSARE